MCILGNLSLNILLSLNWKSASLPVPYQFAIVQGITGLKCLYMSIHSSRQACPDRLWRIIPDCLRTFDTREVSMDEDRVDMFPEGEVNVAELKPGL